MLGYAVVGRLLASQNSLLPAQLTRYLFKNNPSCKSTLNPSESAPFNLRYYGNAGRTKAKQLLWCERHSPAAPPSRNAANLVQARQTESKHYEVATNVAKDVILFKYENPRFFKMLMGFGVMQAFFWTYLGQFAYSTLRDLPVNKDNDPNLPWWRTINLGENKYRNGLTIVSFFIGFGILATSSLYTLRSVRYLILRKGGESVTFVTYTPIGINRMITVPLNKVSCTQNREAARVQLPLKVKGNYFYYMLDMRGEFRNPRLFDYTAGLKRKL